MSFRDAGSANKMGRIPAIAIICLVFWGLAACDGTDGVNDAPESVEVIAHRGASGYLPESTLPAYALAYSMGADYLEMDLVMSRDGVPVVFHDLVLEDTTDVEDVFPGHRRSDGHWYVSDLTVDQLGRLNVDERFSGRFPKGSRGYRIPTFESVLKLVAHLNSASGCSVGIYPELKNPRFHYDEGLPMEQVVLDLLAEYGYEANDDPVYLQSFDPESLKEIRYKHGSELKLIQLIGGGDRYDKLVTPDGLKNVSGYAVGIGPWKGRIGEGDGELVRQAHAQGLLVHPYTFRADQVSDQYSDFQAELEMFVSDFAVDGVFTDQPDQVLGVLDRPSRSASLHDRCR